MTSSGFLFETERLGIRPNDPSIDENVAASLSLSHSKAAQVLIGKSLQDVTFDECKAMMQQRWDELWKPLGVGLFLAYLKADGSHPLERPKFVGMCSLVKDPGSDFLDVGYHLLDAELGKGYATEAADGLIKYCRQHNGVGDVIGITRAANGPSRRVMERLGMSLVATVEAPFLGEKQEFVVYALGEDAEGRGQEYYQRVVSERVGNFSRKHGKNVGGGESGHGVENDARS